MATMQSTMNDICPSSNITCMKPFSLNKNPTTHANSHVSSDTSALTPSNSTSNVSLIRPRVILSNSNGSRLCVYSATSDRPQHAPMVPRFGEQISPRRRERNSMTPPLAPLLPQFSTVTLCSTIRRSHSLQKKGSEAAFLKRGHKGEKRGL